MAEDAFAFFSLRVVFFPLLERNDLLIRWLVGQFGWLVSWLFPFLLI